MPVPANVPADLEVRLPSPLQELSDATLRPYGVRLLLKRDDLISSEVPGNKWRKLKYNLADALASGSTTLLTFGGAYSNHIRAVAAAGRRCGLETIGVIRGEERLPLNPSLAYAARQGMRLTYLDRTTYRRKHDEDVIGGLRERFGAFQLIPEGGSNERAVRGCAEIPAEIDVPFDVICCPVGTGGTLAGIAAGTGPDRQAVGFAVLKGAGFLAGDVADLQRRTYGHRAGSWRIDLDHHFGGYARRTPALDAFIDGFERRHGLRLDRVYGAKMMYGVFSAIREGDIAAGSTVVAVITGVAGEWDGG